MEFLYSINILPIYYYLFIDDPNRNFWQKISKNHKQISFGKYVLTGQAAVQFIVPETAHFAGTPAMLI